MTQVVTVQAVAIVVLAVLVFGLLRSHAEILRTLHQLGAGTGPDADAPPPSRPAQVARSSSTGFDVVGTTVADEVLRIGVVGARQGTLLAFLTSGCFTCAGFWDAFRTGPRLTVPGGARLVIVTKGPEDESGSRIATLSPADVPVVMSTAAWEDYEVPVAPYFVYVDGPSGKILGEGVAQTWEQVTSLWTQALDDAARGSRRRDGGTEARADRDLAQAGILPGHPSLHPSPGVTTAPQDDR